MNLRHEIILSSLAHTENGYVYNQLNAGKKWNEAFGIGGSSNPAPWMGTSKGIAYDGGLITPSEISNFLIHQRDTILIRLFGIKWFAENRGIKQGEQLKIEFI